ncbi:hypothetical protein GCM10020220_025230 [Nonomuraea rubra]
MGLPSGARSAGSGVVAARSEAAGSGVPAERPGAAGSEVPAERSGAAIWSSRGGPELS